MAGFDYRTYKEMPQGHDAKNVEPIRVHHRDCFLKSYSANDFGSSAKSFAVESHHVVQFLGVRKMSWAREIAVMDFVGFRYLADHEPCVVYGLGRENVPIFIRSERTCVTCVEAVVRVDNAK